MYVVQLKKNADSLVRETLSDRVDEISCMLDSLKDKLVHIENNIEWDEKLIK